MTERPILQLTLEKEKDTQESVVVKTKKQLTELDSHISTDKKTTTTQATKISEKKGLLVQEESKKLKNKSIPKNKIVQATQQPNLEKKSTPEDTVNPQNVLAFALPNIPDFSVLPKGKMGVPLLSKGNLVQKNNKIYDITEVLYYPYKTGNDLQGNDYETKKQQGILIDNGAGKIFILEKEGIVITGNEVIQQLGPPRLLQDNIYIDANNLKRKILGASYYEINAINSGYIRDTIQKYKKENIGFFIDKGIPQILFGFKEEKEIPESTIEHFDATDIREWGNGKEKLSFYSLSDLRNNCVVDGNYDAFFEGGINTEQFGRIPPAQLLIVIEKDVAGKEVKKIYKKPNRKIILGDASLYQGIPNSQEIAQSIMNDVIEGSTDYSKVSQRMHYLAQEMKKECTSEEELIKIVYQYVKERLSYRPHVREYFDQLAKFKRGEITQKPKDLYIPPQDGSGIETFSNRIGVCEGYTENALFLLSFAGIKNVKVIKGIAPSADDLSGKGPNGWSKEQEDQMFHAWLKIENKHYDVTWDDKEENPSWENEWFGVSDEVMKQKGRKWTE